MKINFTRKEYRLLLDMLYLADWALNAKAADIDKYGHPEHRAVHKKILSHYKEMGAEDIIFYDNKIDDYYETKEYEDTVHEKYLEPYENEMFWDELIERLSFRDLAEKVETETLQNMKSLERITELDKFSESYTQEFEIHGLGRLKIQKV